MKLKKSISLPFLVLATLFLSSLACQSEYEIEKAKQTEIAHKYQGTPTAMQGTITALEATIDALEQKPLPAITTTPAKDCLITTDYWGSEICIEADEFSRGFLQDNEVSEGKLITVADPGSAYLWYYDSAGNTLGQLSAGLSFDYSEDQNTNEYIVQLKGWIASSDLDLNPDQKTGTVLCKTHPWDHVDNKPLCHAHFWNSSEQVLATIPENLEFKDAGVVGHRYIKDENGVTIRAPGREVVIEQLVRIRKENADTQ